MRIFNAGRSITFLHPAALFVKQLEVAQGAAFDQRHVF